MSLEYLLASMPMLFPDREPLISVKDFIAACESQLSSADAEAARLLVLDDVSPSAHPAVCAWRDIEAAIDGAIGRRRLALRGTQAGGEFSPPETRVCPVWLQRAVEDAFTSTTDPMSREEALLRVRWQAAEDFGGEQPMARSQIFAMAVKLRLATRRAALSAEVGASRLEAALPQQTL